MNVRPVTDFVQTIRSSKGFLLQVSGFVEESHRRDESEDENWQRVAQQISLTNEQLVALSHLRNTMRMRYISYKSYLDSSSQKIKQIFSFAVVYFTRSNRI